MGIPGDVIVEIHQCGDFKHLGKGEHLASFPVVAAIGIDQRLTQISDFLSQLKVSPSGKIFIIERDGLMVASSSNEPPYTSINGKPKRLQVLDSKDPMIRSTAQYLQKSFGNFRKINNSQQLEFRINKSNFPWERMVQQENFL